MALLGSSLIVIVEPFVSACPTVEARYSPDTSSGKDPSNHINIPNLDSCSYRMLMRLWLLF